MGFGFHTPTPPSDEDVQQSTLDYATINRATGWRFIRQFSNGQGGVYGEYLMQDDEGYVTHSYHTWFREEDLVDIDIKDLPQPAPPKTALKYRVVDRRSPTVGGDWNRDRVDFVKPLAYMVREKDFPFFWLLKRASDDLVLDRDWSSNDLIERFECGVYDEHLLDGAH